MRVQILPAVLYAVRNHAESAVPRINRCVGVIAARTVVTPEMVRSALMRVMDPEYGTLSIVDLGIVDDVAVDDERVSVTLLPTMAGCPAREVIESDVRTALYTQGLSEVEVVWRLGWQLGAEHVVAVGGRSTGP